MAEITPSELSARLTADDDTFVLDVQRVADFEDWHVPGSVNIDVYDELHTDLEAARDALLSIPEEEVILTCTAGPASEKAAELLRGAGYEVKTLACHRP